jgi:hypothetical protein
MAFQEDSLISLAPYTYSFLCQIFARMCQLLLGCSIVSILSCFIARNAIMLLFRNWEEESFIGLGSINNLLPGLA